MFSRRFLARSSNSFWNFKEEMFLVEDIREVEVFEKEESRHTQVSGIGVIEDVQVKIVLGAGACWPCCSSKSWACTYTEIPSSTCVYCRLALR
jgi:hypothetical protein